MSLSLSQCTFLCVFSSFHIQVCVILEPRPGTATMLCQSQTILLDGTLRRIRLIRTLHILGRYRRKEGHTIGLALALFPGQFSCILISLGKPNFRESLTCLSNFECFLAGAGAVAAMMGTIGALDATCLLPLSFRAPEDIWTWRRKGRRTQAPAREKE